MRNPADELREMAIRAFPGYEIDEAKFDVLREYCEAPMTPLERAARALCELDGNIPGATMDGKPLWRDYLPEVRAVLQAIREPSEGMKASAAARCGGGWEQEDEELLEQASDYWQAMIDAALEEG